MDSLRTSSAHDTKPHWLQNAHHEKLRELSPSDFDIPSDFSFPSSENPVQAKFHICGEGWTLDFEIGRGGFGRTYLATHQITGVRYVLKFLIYEDDPEYKFLKTVPVSVFRSKNIMTCVGVAEGISAVFKGRPGKVWGTTDCPSSLPNVIIFMEALTNGELLNFLISMDVTNVMAKPKEVKDTTMRHFVGDIIRGMNTLAKAGISHRDMKPDNLLMDEHGRVVIIDLGKAKRYSDCQESIKNEQPSKVSRNASNFFGEQTGAMGTFGYNAPEVCHEGGTYDSELADVFSVGIIVFQMKKATMASWVHGDYDPQQLTERGLDPEVYKVAEKQAGGGHFSDELIALVQSMLSRNPQRRPRFELLEAACNGDQSVVAKHPHLKWLAGEKADPMTFIQELMAHKPNIHIKCPGIIEAFAEWVRVFNDVPAAFKAANTSNSGNLSTLELYEAIERDMPGKFDVKKTKLGAEAHQNGLAALMYKYTGGSSTMTSHTFQQMCDEWSFGGRAIVPVVGKQKLRYFAFLPRTDSSVFCGETEWHLFTKYFMNACESSGFKVDANEEASDLASEEAQLKHIIFTANMQTMGVKGKPEDACRLRFDTFLVGGQFLLSTHSDLGGQAKFVMASKKVWGSTAEEMYMLKKINDVMARQWGSRTEAPKVWDD